MALDAARHLCQEASAVLTSLRGGPPMVARGDLAQDLIDLRALIRHTMNLEPQETSSTSPPPSPARVFEPDTALDPLPPVDVGVFARPFLAVIVDPRAAGPHTLVALRALHRLLDNQSLVPVSAETPHIFTVALEPLTKGILNCKFEQTDAGADEAVEMAIADLLSLVVQLDRRALRTETFMDAFNTVFVTCNTFVHSPALCYHFEDVLTSMCKAVFGELETLRDLNGRLLLEFLVNQLLQTPLINGIDEASREERLMYDSTRVLCLRLARTALQVVFEETFWSNEDLAEASIGNLDGVDRSLLQIVQDDLCLSLLMTGQAVWAYQDSNSGFISLEVLSEICSTLSTLWTSIPLRKHLVSQFEAIFTGFYQRALALLRKRPNPHDSIAFHSNVVFDGGVEIILESLVDIMTLHDHSQTVAQGNGGSLETLFSLYDCNIKRSDVAVELMIDLCRCTGSRVDEEGDMLDISVHEGPTPHNSDVSPTPVVESDAINPIATFDMNDFVPSKQDVTSEGYRQVPPHLRELCAEAIIGGMKCLFRDDHPSEETKSERHNRQSILLGHVSPAPQSWSDLNQITSSHHLRNIKSKKRLMRRAAQLFNKKANRGIEFLLQSGVIQEPVTPRAVASFLRNAIVVGLDKKAAGAYLGEVGKSPDPGRSQPVWDLDWFHKEVLENYCSLFRFEHQSLLDGLRMFLAAFRLPGEAQQIDRILQAFSDCCSRVCEEGVHGNINIFSEDPKRASDAAYLLSFSIIMLNTDQHNDNIREDRKMSKADFVKNNTDYGRDITEVGKELPREYLEAIYDSIKEEEIRTEGEGADGSMTVERWKDVLRGSAEDESHADDLPSVHDAEDLAELVLESVWKPIMSSISALWRVNSSSNRDDTKKVPGGPIGVLGAQGARLGMDMAWDMLVGVRQLGRTDIFCKIFNCVCKYTGLLDYTTDAATRTAAFVNSVECQGAFVVALRIAKEATDEIGIDGWKRIWLMLFELRDLKLLGGGTSSRGKSLLMESDADLLREDLRREWTMKLIKRGNEHDSQMKKSSGVSSVFGAMGRALFGTTDAVDEPSTEIARTPHGKEDDIIWDDIAPSDDEDDSKTNFDETENAFSLHGDRQLTIGAKFEGLLIQEDLVLIQQRETPVTGLERVDDSNGNSSSPRARVRKRLSRHCDYAGIISDSRFMDDNNIGKIVEALITLMPSESPPIASTTKRPFDRENSYSEFSGRLSHLPISPASAAFAEILIVELALRNRDRLSVLWHNCLKAHYHSRLRSIMLNYTEDDRSQLKVINGSMEKCISGMLRISCCGVQRGEICNDVLETWSILGEVDETETKKSLANSFDRHLSEGLWRITRSIDGGSGLSEDGWKGLMALITWCANRGYTLPPVKQGSIGRPVGLAEDDPAFQAYRSLHYLLNVSEVKEFVPPSTVDIIRTLIAAGEARHCPKLSVAGIDLLHVLCNIVEASALNISRDNDKAQEKTLFWQKSWLPVLESMAEACDTCSISTVRQHALSMLTDSFLENQGGLIPVVHLCVALGNLCIPLAGRRIKELRASWDGVDPQDEIMIELELCIGLIFKPLRHHVQNIVNDGGGALVALWKATLDVLKIVLGGPVSPNEMSDDDPAMVNVLAKSFNELALEHLRNVIMVLIDYDILHAESKHDGDISAWTWTALGEIECCKKYLDEWKQAAAK